MNTIAHALYGVTVCSKTGLAGGKRGAVKRSFITDPTVWYAALFGILPDLISLGVPFFSSLMTNRSLGHFFRNITENDLLLYRYMHSLIIALAVSGLLYLAYKPLLIPSLSWPLHVLMDSITHDLGRFRTLLFYPLSEWGFEGIPWWRHNGVALTYWTLLPVIWLCIWFWRQGFKKCKESIL